MMEEPVVIVTERNREHLMTVQEFADLLRVHPLTIYKWIREDRLDGVVRAGRHLRIDASKHRLSKESHKT